MIGTEEAADVFTIASGDRHRLLLGNDAYKLFIRPNVPNLFYLVYLEYAENARAGVKADGSCRCESGGPPEYGAGVFSRRRTPMDARLASLLRPGAAITLSLNNNGFRMVQ